MSYQAGAYLQFLQHEATRSISTPPGWDASPPSIKFADTHLYTWVERSTVKAKCLAQEHNTVTAGRARTQTARSRVERTNNEATTPP